MRSALALVALMLGLASQPEAAQARDPYAAAVAGAARRDLDADFATYLDGVRTLYFAAGCKVFAYEGLAEYPIQNNLLRFMNTVAPAAEVMRRIRSARAEGLSRAASGCATFHDDPDAVLALRRLAQAGVMP